MQKEEEFNSSWENQNKLSFELFFFFFSRKNKWDLGLRKVE